MDVESEVPLWADVPPTEAVRPKTRTLRSLAAEVSADWPTMQNLKVKCLFINLAL